MTDEQAAAAKAEMEQLVGSSDSMPVVPSPSEETELVKTLLQQVNQSFHQIEEINKKIDQISVSISKVEKHESQQTNIYENVKILTDKVEQISECVKEVEDILNKPIEIKFGKSKKPTTELTGYNSMIKEKLKDIAKERQINITTRMSKHDIINALEKADITKN
jgi:Na+/phosphate symporter